MTQPTNASALERNLLVKKSTSNDSTTLNKKSTANNLTVVNNKLTQTNPTPVNNKLNQTNPTSVNNNLTPINPPSVTNKLNSTDSGLFNNKLTKLNIDRIKNHRLFYPESWNPTLNPYATTANNVIADWLTELKIIKDQETLKLFEQERADLYGGYMFSLARFKELTAVSKFLVLWILFDDLVVESSHDYWQKNNLSIDDYVEAMRGGKLSENADVFLRAWWEIGQCFVKKMSQKWRDRIANSFAHWLRESIRERELCLSLREQGKLPDLSTYLDIRSTSIGVVETFYLIEYAEDFELPDQVTNHPVIQSLYELGTKIIVFINDIFSLEKDIRSNWPNVVTVIQQEYGLTLSDALHKAVELHNDCVLNFTDIEKQIPSFGPNIDPFVLTHIDRIRLELRGTAEFHNGAERYQWKNDLAPGKAPFAVSLASFVDK